MMVGGGVGCREWYRRVIPSTSRRLWVESRCGAENISVAALSSGGALVSTTAPFSQRHVSNRFAPLRSNAWKICRMTSTESAQNQPEDTAWVLSGTTSPADHSPLSEVQVDYQINDQPPSLGYSGLYPRMERPLVTKTMQLELLRSLPENARLKIGVFDRQDLGQEATFQLTGLDSVRKKIGLACKWPADSKQNFIGVAMNPLSCGVGHFV